MIQLVRADVIAKSLDLSERQVLRLAAAGTLPAVRIGRSVRFDPAAIEAWMREHSNGTEAVGGRPALRSVPDREALS